MECKYCGKLLRANDREHDYRKRLYKVYYECSCGASCVKEKVYGLWKYKWTKEDAQ